jgi:MFS family permease
MAGRAAGRRGGRGELPAGVRTLQAGLVVNAFGNGAAAPFLIVYLYNVRGIPLPLAGLASGTAAGFAVLATLAAGPSADRFGMRPTMVGGLALSTLAYGLYPLVAEPWHAVGLAALAGAGIGTWLTMQSSLLAAITPARLRHVAFAWQRVAANVGLGLGGFAGGLIVTTSRPSTFALLFWLNAGTFVVYTAFLVRIAVPAQAGRAARPGSYRAVLADHVFVRLVALNVAIVAAAIALLTALVPVYVKNEANLSEQVIGLLFLLNALTIVALQLPVTRRTEGRLRMRAFALMAVLFAVSLLLIAVAPAPGNATAALTVLVVAIVVYGVAECLYDAVQGPLVSDLAPSGLLGRYLAVTAFSWQLGFIVGPALGALILAAAPTALWLVTAGLCLAISAYSLRLDRHLPERARRTPGGATGSDVELAAELTG